MSQNDKLYARKKMNKKKREPGVKKAVQITMIDIAPEAFARQATPNVEKGVDIYVRYQKFFQGL